MVTVKNKKIENIYMRKWNGYERCVQKQVMMIKINKLSKNKENLFLKKVISSQL